MRFLASALMGLLVLAAAPAQACRVPPTYGDEAARQSAAWREYLGQSATASGVGIIATARCYGAAPDAAVVGYKAGLTSRTTQERFGATAPLLGVLFDGMIEPGGATLEWTPGERPRWEADLLLVVGSDAINEATSREEALSALRGYRPFIEVPRLGADDGTPLTAERLGAANVGAWRGAAGPERPLPADALTSLASMRVVALGEDGAVLAEGRGTDVLGHPLDVVLWVRDAVKARGGRLKPDDVISVGSFTPLTAPKPGQTVRVRYEGLSGDPEVSVSFR